MTQSLEDYRNKINQDYLLDESVLLDRLLRYLTDYDAQKIEYRAQSIVENIRKNHKQENLITAFMQEYQLYTCLQEAFVAK